VKLKSFLTALISTNHNRNKNNSTTSESLSQPVLSEYTRHDPPIRSTFETKLKDYYKATYVMYVKLHQEAQKAIADKYQDYIDIQELRKDILNYSQKKTG